LFYREETKKFGSQKSVVSLANIGAAPHAPRVVREHYIRDADHFAALIAWMLFLRGDYRVKGGPEGPPPQAVFDP
jgi:hypothetical protein